TLIAQKPDAIVQILGTLSVIDPWLKKARDAGIPVLTVDVGSTNSINNTTSDNWGIGKDLNDRIRLLGNQRLQLRDQL
ncbi:substrate-binding domain-containing protein, partial [Rhizobium ruizarguesonis]